MTRRSIRSGRRCTTTTYCCCTTLFYEPPYFLATATWGNVVVAALPPTPGAPSGSPPTSSSVGCSATRTCVGFAECSAGWPPAWSRLGGQKRYMRHAVPETKLDDPMDYVRAGHVFCGIELYEGETLAKSIVDVVGDDVLMYQSDYPHPGGEFPTRRPWSSAGRRSGKRR